jgi:hypothetical protein
MLKKLWLVTVGLVVVIGVLVAGVSLAPNAKAAGRSLAIVWEEAAKRLMPKTEPEALRVEDESLPPASYTEAMDRLEIAKAAAETFAQDCQNDIFGPSWVVQSARLGAGVAADRAWDDAALLSDAQRTALADSMISMDVSLENLERSCPSKEVVAKY